MSLVATKFYITGGTLQRDAQCYVERQADKDLFNALKESKFCYVLTSRQMGKSSLMVRTAARLRNEGATVIVLDLTAIGQNLTAEQWYNGLLNQIGVQLDMEDELEDFWCQHKQLGPLQRCMKAVREILLTRTTQQIIIFIDEIDAVRSLPFSTDEFFAGIRAAYNRRTQDTELNRLTFCLLGVATPADLIKETRTTPFNIGVRIELNDFTESEAMPLAQGLGRDNNLNKQLLKRVLYWTGGHPYLTQRICLAVADTHTINSIAGVDRICDRLFLSTRAQELDDNLLFVRDRIMKSETDLAGLLECYQKVHKGERVRDDETNQFVTILRLAGIAAINNRTLQVRNNIYRRVFDQEWIKAHMPDAELIRQRAARRRGQLQATAVTSVVIILLAILTINLIIERNLTKKQALEKRQLLYASQLALAYQSWEKGNAAQTAKLMQSQQPEAGQEDLRGFEWHYLWHLSQSNILTFKGHTNSVQSVAFSPDGRLVATGSDDGSAKLWQTASGKELITLKGHTNFVNAVAFSPDGKIVATGSSDASAKLWDIASGKEILALKGFAASVYTMAFSPDGKTVATGSSDATIKLWDVSSGKELTSFSTNTTFVNTIAFSPDSRIVAMGSNDSTTKLWDIISGKEALTLKGRTDAVYAMAFSPDGRMVATGSTDANIKLWDLTNGKEVRTLSGHASAIRAIAFSPDSRILCASDDSAVKLWDVGSGKELTVLTGHAGVVKSIAFSPDGRMVATAGIDATAKLWDLAATQRWIELASHFSAITAVAFSHRGNLLATASTDQTVKLWDRATGQFTATLVSHTDKVSALAFSPDDKLLATASDDSTIKLWDLSNQNLVATLKNHQAMVNSIAFSPDGRMLASASSDRSVKLWDVARQQELYSFNSHSDSVYAVRFSPDGQRLATGSWDKTIMLWDVAGRRHIRTLSGHQERIYALEFSPDGKMLASASWHNEKAEYKLWDTANFAELTTIPEKNRHIPQLAFTPNNKRLAMGVENGGIKLIDIFTGMELAVLNGHKLAVSALAFSPDGQIMVSGSTDATVKIWHTDNDELARLHNWQQQDMAINATARNLNFEQGSEGQYPLGWFSNPLVKEDGFTATISEEQPCQGKRCALLTRNLKASPFLKRNARNQPIASMAQRISAASYRGQRVRMRAAVRIKPDDPEARAHLWLRVDRANGQMGFFDRMYNRPIVSKEWGYYEIIGEIDNDAEWLNFGVLLANGEGKVWIDDISFEVIGKAVPINKPANSYVRVVPSTIVRESKQR